ncbi:hypothetical protein FDENT_7411 [Fusarium denticulatum]|uniref:Mid2 domain-containing protein n=1 Tax=Fusarium denticulatum TaxID=48507 RepID=A0A8H5U9A8_9HYPO|nr:hypothetical protein FDENT_7411 [Fusarium denticulatum]
MGFLRPWNQGPNKDYSENQQFTIGSNIILSWSIDFEDPDLQLWQDNLPGDAQGGPSTLIKESLNVSVYDWVVSYEGLDPSRNPVFYFQLQNGDRTAVSHYFNISDRATDDPDQLDRTSSVPVYSTTGPPLSSTQTRTVSEATATQEIQAAATDLSAGGIAGIVLGALGVAMIFIGGLWWCWRRKSEVQPHPTAGQTQDQFVAKSKGVQESGGEIIHEVSAMEEPSRIFEVDGTSITRK